MFARERRRLPIAAAGVALLALGAAGCGDGSGDTADSRQATADARASTPATTSTTPPVLTPDAGKPNDTRSSTLEPLLTGEAIVHVAASKDLIAVSVGNLAGSMLYVGAPTVSGSLRLVPAKGAGTVPSIADIRVGTDAEGQPVVSYPRCDDGHLARCVPVQWSPRTNRETTVPGFTKVGGPLEVAVDRGNAAVIATTDEQATIDGLRTGESGVAKRDVWVRHADEDARTVKLVTPSAIALHGDTLGTISQTGTDDVGVCGQDRADLWQIDRPTAKPRHIGTVTCGLGGTQMVSLDLGPRDTRVVVTANGEDGHSELLTYDGATGKTRRTRLGVDVFDVAWFSQTTGFAVSPVSDACTDGLYDTSGGGPTDLTTCNLGRLTLKPHSP